MRRTSRGQTQKWLDEWDRFLNGTLEKLLAMLEAAGFADAKVTELAHDPLNSYFVSRKS